MRIHPILHWREIDIFWRYTAARKHPLCAAVSGASDGLRYRSLGEKNITTPIKSDASTIEEIIAELETTGGLPSAPGRTMDHDSEADSFERLRRSGYMRARCMKVAAIKSLCLSAIPGEGGDLPRRMPHL